MVGHRRLGGRATLADHLKHNPWPETALPRLLHDIVRGLAALHNAGIIFRELAPARVLIADHDRRAVLTEFELAKLLDGSPSVSSEWPEDPYRAPEIDGGTATIQSDLYSLAHVAVAAISGSDADALHSEESLGSVKLPKRLQRLLLQSLEPIPAKRPIDLAPVMKELSCWSEK